MTGCRKFPILSVFSAQIILALSAHLLSTTALAATETKKTLEERLAERMKDSHFPTGPSAIFDLPVTYNKRVAHWIRHFQGNGKTWFRQWLEKSSRYVPYIQKHLRDNNLPQDLAYVVMIESGFNQNAVSSANAVGPWQFIRGTGEQYGLKVNYWLDERRDLKKSTEAAIKYIQNLNSEFGSWYLVAAGYNMGEGALRSRIQKYQTRDYWKLCQRGALPQETMDYVPKILAAMVIAKAPGLYGFRDLAKFEPLEYDIVSAPGGLELRDLAEYLGVTKKSLMDINSELTSGRIPANVYRHHIRVPKGATAKFSDYVSKNLSQDPRLTMLDGKKSPGLN